MDKKLSLYLQYDIDQVYKNTPEEEAIIANVWTLYCMAKSSFDSGGVLNSQELEKWRRSYLGRLPAQDIHTGKDSKVPGKQIRKLVYELIESKIDTSIPLPRMRANSKALLPAVQRTEDMLKFELDRLLTEATNDIAERNTYIDGTTVYKISWNPLLKTRDKAGDVEVTVMPIDSIVPQPGVPEYQNLEYLFERSALSTSKIYDLYGRVVRSTRRLNDVSAAQAPNNNGRQGTEVVDMVNLITFYFLNSERRVGRIIFTEETLTMLDYEEDWLVKKINVAEEGKKPKLETMKTEILTEDLYKLKNQYASSEQGPDGNPLPDARQAKVDQGLSQGMTQEQAEANAAPWKGELFLPKGTEIPLYHIHELPFIFRQNVSRMNSLYGISDAEMLIDIQDELNKAWSRTGEKIQQSGGILFKDKKVSLGTDNKVLKVVDLSDPSLASSSKYVDINPQVTGDIAYASNAYESGRSTIGITNSWQGKQDSTATSGKAKEISSLATAGRLEAPRVMKREALSQVYRMIFLFKLAFSSQRVSFTKLLPEAREEEREWDRYMFLDKDDEGNLFWHDEFAFSVDAAATLSNDRQAMWQETQQQFINGTFGDPTNPRNLLTFWGVMEQLQYPLAKFAIASIKENMQHLDVQTEQLLVTHPDVLQLAMTIAKEKGLIEGRGGARENSGPDGNGFSQSANVARTNERNSLNSKSIDSKIVEGAKSGGGN